MHKNSLKKVAFKPHAKSKKTGKSKFVQYSCVSLCDILFGKHSRILYVNTMFEYLCVHIRKENDCNLLILEIANGSLARDKTGTIKKSKKTGKSLFVQYFLSFSSTPKLVLYQNLSSCLPFILIGHEKWSFVYGYLNFLFHNFWFCTIRYISCRNQENRCFLASYI